MNDLKELVERIESSKQIPTFQDQEDEDGSLNKWIADLEEKEFIEAVLGDS